MLMYLNTKTKFNGAPLMSLVELAALWFAQSMLKEHIFTFQQSNYPKGYSEI